MSFFAELKQSLQSQNIDQQLYELAKQLYPICRSITGDGIRQTLSILQNYISLEQHEVPSGTSVFDWEVPKEWNVRDAYIKNSQGEKIIDFQKLNLHLLNYSTPIQATLSFEELKPHLHSLPETPDLVPYRTSYYNENWGFCLSHSQLLDMAQDEEYEVYIDTSLREGHLTYGEYLIPGQTEEEVLISCHICHPSLANDNLSGIVIATLLAQALSSLAPKFSYRFLFIPVTIGSITWLARNEDIVHRIKHGLVLTCLGDDGQFTYKKSRQGDAEIDRIAAHVLKHSGSPYEIQGFSPYGYDERQYCSPGFDLPVGCLMRSPHGTFPEYHTSGDNLEFVRPEYLAASLRQILSILEVLEQNKIYVSENPKCEPQLGKRGLYKTVSGQKEITFNQMAILWVLNLADGQHSLLDIAERSKLRFDEISEAVNALQRCGLLKAD